MHFIAGTIEETGIDERHAVARLSDTATQVQRGPTFFIHNAHFQGIRCHTEHCLNAGKQFVGERHFQRTVHFRFHNIDAASARVFLHF